MIIKSLSRKSNSREVPRGQWKSWSPGQGKSPFAHLVHYMNHGIGVEQDKAVIWQHFYGGAHSSEKQIIAHFEENAKHLAFRKNGNVLYHEIISFSAGYCLSQVELTNIVADIGQEYLRLRAPEQLAYGVVHFDTEYIHLHLMISANSVGRSERVRLSKQRFADIQKQLEGFVLERYPDMGQTPVYHDKVQREQCKRGADEQAMTLRTNLPSRKEVLAERLLSLFLQADTVRDFEWRCQLDGLRFYQRGKTLGVVMKDADGVERKHRLSTLGVLTAYESMQKRFLEQSRNTIEWADADSYLISWDSTLEKSGVTGVEVSASTDELAGESVDAKPSEQDDFLSGVVLPPERGILLPGDDILFQYLNMNSKQAKELSLPSFLHQLGFASAHRRGNDVWYTSPFRPNEQTPSFKIDYSKNVWFDFGMGKGGTIIEFVQHLYATEDVARVLAIIAEVNGGVAQSVRQIVPESDIKLAVKKEKPIIESVGSITDKMLENYLAGRAIPLDLARLYLKEIAYHIGGRWYRALAFVNDAKGYEIRNPWFKGTLGKKDISFLVNPTRRDTAIFEGVFDFLAMLTYFKQDQPASNVLVLNSVGLIERGIERLNAHEIRHYHSYLDHDLAGRTTLTTLRERLPGEVIDDSGFYLGHKDVNEFLIHHRKQQRSREQIRFELER